MYRCKHRAGVFHRDCQHPSVSCLPCFLRLLCLPSPVVPLSVQHPLHVSLLQDAVVGMLSPCVCVLLFLSDCGDFPFIFLRSLYLSPDISVSLAKEPAATQAFARACPTGRSLAALSSYLLFIMLSLPASSLHCSCLVSRLALFLQFSFFQMCVKDPPTTQPSSVSARVSLTDRSSTSPCNAPPFAHVSRAFLCSVCLPTVAIRAKWACRCAHVFVADGYQYQHNAQTLQENVYANRG